jgi:hypothetical protein
LAQQGSPPRRPGRHSAPDPGPGPYGGPPYDDQRGDDQPPADPYAADPHAADPYAADPYGSDPRRTDPRSTQPYTQPGAHSQPEPYGQPDDPYAAQDPYAPGGDSRGPRADPYGPRDPYAPDRRTPDPRSADPRSADPYGADSYGADSYGADSYGADPRSADPRSADPRSADPRNVDPYGVDPRSTDSYGADPYGARQAASAQAPPRYAPQEHQEPQRSPVAQAAAAPAPAPARGRRTASQPGRPAGRVSADPFTAGDDEDDLPPWAGLTIRPARAEGGSRTKAEAEPQEAEPDEGDPADGAAPPRRRGLGRGRAAAARLRKSRRRVYVYCGTAVVLAVAVAGYFALQALPKHTPAPSFITSLQPGEFATVPGACASVDPALVTSYLPGQVTKVNPAGASATDSQCSFTVDHKPVFRVLNVTAQAYQPSAVAAGNGSATDNAVDNFVIAEQTLRAPGKKSAVPPAQVSLITGLGTEAFRGVQVIHAGPIVNDQVTVVTRQRNLVVTVTFQAQAAGNGFGPVDASTVQAGALAVARAVLAHDTAHAAAG